ncbi:response regulator transcription factor [Allofournierella sp.]|uniref:response regulator transcription factor n=1 Tax=Allofournierella sp. TaxID=1940256 RepID=UPI003AF1016F
MPNILIVEDDPSINGLIAEYLRQKGAVCTQAFSGTEGRLCFGAGGFDLVLMDLMLPGLPGEELLAWLRQKSGVPVIVLTARDELGAKVALLSGGADDYLTKPFELDELWARIGVQLRHAGTPPQSGLLVYRDWVIDPAARTLTAAGSPVELTAHEFDILELLAAHPAKVFTKQEIFEAVWRQDYFVEDKTINVHISNLRAKLRPTGTESYIQTVWGIGFKLAP